LLRALRNRTRRASCHRGPAVSLCAGRPNIPQMIDLPTKRLGSHDIEYERGDMDVPWPVRGREVAYSVDGLLKPLGGSRGGFLEGGSRRPFQLCDRFVTCPSEALVRRAVR
jgi:hypothetical protein